MRREGEIGMNQEQLERIEYMAQAAKEAGVMLVIAPEVVLDLVANNRALRAFSNEALLKAGSALSEADGLEAEVERLKAEVKRLKDKANQFLDSLENEGLYQDYDEYVALKESFDEPEA